jgi:hypothetical protein
VTEIVTIREAAAIEAAAFDEEQRIVPGAVLIRAGLSRNRNRYREEVLARDCHIMEGLPARSGHYRSGDLTGRSDPRNLAGTWRNVRYADGAVRGDLHVFEHYLPVLRSAREAGELIGVSIDLAAKPRVVRENGQLIREVEALIADPGNSVDIVVQPAAGGRLFESAAVDPWWTSYREVKMNLTLEDIKARPALWRLVEATVENAEDLTAEELASRHPALAEALEALARELDSSAQDSDASGGSEDSGGEGRSAETDGADEVRQLLEEARRERCGVLLEARLAEARLPAKAAELVRSEFAGRVFEPGELDRRIRGVKEALDEAAQSARVTGLGARVTQDARDRMIAAIDGMLAGQPVDGVPPFRSFREAYCRWTGKDWLTPPLEILRDTHGGGYDSERSVEALLTTTWAAVFADRLHKRLIAEFSRPDADQEWRQITSTISSVTDFRPQYLVKYGGFGVLPVVPENGTYHPLANPVDGSESYTLGKRGGLFTITLETIANDDLRAIRSIPVAMGRAARQTLNRDVFGVLTSNPTMGDNVTLFHPSSTLRGGDGSTNGSGNQGSAPLSSATLSARRVNMLKRATFGNTIGGQRMDAGTIIPRLLIVPPDLEETAWRLTNSQVLVQTSNFNATEPNWHRNAYQVLVVPFWTDPNDWYLCADPASAPTLEVGFYQGRQQPEIFTKEEFEADALTYKVRFIYGIAVEEPLSWDRSVV